MTVVKLEIYDMHGFVRGRAIGRPSLPVELYGVLTWWRHKKVRDVKTGLPVTAVEGDKFVRGLATAFTGSTYVKAILTEEDEDA